MSLLDKAKLYLQEKREKHTDEEGFFPSVPVPEMANGNTGTRVNPEPFPDFPFFPSKTGNIESEPCMEPDRVRSASPLIYPILERENGKNGNNPVTTPSKLFPFTKLQTGTTGKAIPCRYEIKGSCPRTRIWQDHYGRWRCLECDPPTMKDAPPPWGEAVEGGR